MADWLTLETARRGASAVVSAAAKLAAPLVRRMRAVRRAAAEGEVPPDPFDDEIDEVIAWLRGEPRDDTAQEKLRTWTGHLAVSVGVFQRPSVREWLSRADVVADLQRAARHCLLNPTKAGLAAAPTTLTAYEQATGEHRHAAEDVFAQAVGVLVASVRSAQDLSSALAVAAVVHQGDRLAGDIAVLKDRVAVPEVIAAGAAKLGESVRTALDDILLRRAVVPEDETRGALADLDRRLRRGDLKGAPDACRAEVLWWAARFAASDPGPEYDALLAEARALDPVRDFGLHDALRLAAMGRLDEALQRLRPRADPDARSLVLSLLFKAERRTDALAWLGELDALAPDALTAIGWRNLGAVLFEAGRATDAVSLLSRCPPEHEAACPDILYVRGLARAACLFPTYAHEAFLHGRVPVGASMREGPEADAFHDAAVADFQRASEALESIRLNERGRNARISALTLRLLRPASREAARGELAAAFAAAAAPPLDLVRLALHFGAEFDRAGVEAALGRAERLGRLDANETEARLALLEHGDPGQLSAYIEANVGELKRHFPDGHLAGLRVEALTRAGNFVRARQVLDQARDLLGDDHARLSALVRAEGGSDPTEALAALARQTGALIDVENLCRTLERAGNWAALVAPARVWLAQVPNTENLLRVVVAVHRSGAPDAETLASLDEYPALVQADRRLSLARAHALLGSGRIADAVAWSKEIYERHGKAEEAIAATNAAILSGDWDMLRSIAARELDRHAEREAGHLGWIAMVCGERDGAGALALARKAAARPEADAVTLLRCADVALRADADADEEAFGWVRQAHELSGETGPVRTFDRSEAVSLLVERAEHSRSVATMLSSAQLPLHLAAEAQAGGLTRLVLGSLHQNAREVDARRRSVLPLQPGSRGLAPPSSVRRPIVDLTSLLLLAHLDVLTLLGAAFDSVVVPWSTMVALRQEMDRVRHHQRSVVRKAERLRRLLASETLRPLPARRGRVDSTLEREVGSELAGLFARARDDSGRVVHPVPVSRVGSEEDEPARLGEAAGTILTTRQFVDMLRARGALDSERHATVTAVLSHHDTGEPTGPAYSDGPLFLSWLAVAYLEPLGLLDALPRAGLTAFVSEEVEAEVSAHAEYEIAAGQMAEAIHRIRAWYAAGVAAGTVAVAPRLRGAANDDDGDDAVRQGHAEVLREFLHASGCDGAHADDRFLLRHARRGEGAGAVPLFGTLDLLQHLADGPALHDARHWALRHRLRLGGAACVPLDADELRHHLAHLATAVDGESEELRAIREGIAILRLRDVLVLPDEQTYLLSLLRTACIAVRQIWADEGVPLDVARRQADWVWEHVLPRWPDWWHRLPVQDRRDPTGEDLRDALAFGIPLLAPDAERARAAGAWIADRVLEPRWMDSGFVRVALDAARAHILELVTTIEPPAARADAAEILLEWTPRPIRADLRVDPAFIEAAGLRERLPLARVAPDLVFPRTPLWRSVRAALRGGTMALRDLRRDREVQFEDDGGRLAMHWEEDGQRQDALVPVDALLLSPAKQQRLQALDRLVGIAGPSGPDPVLWRPRLEVEPSDTDVAILLDEVASSVPVRRARAAEALARGTLDLPLLVPREEAYWEALCGSPPGGRSVEDWIEAVWRPRIDRLATRFGAAGLRLLAAANAKPGMMDGSPQPSSILLDLETEAAASWGPFSLLGLFELAAAQAAASADAADLADRLGKRLLGMLVADAKAGEGRLEIFAGLFRLVLAALAVAPCMSGQPPWWRRLCALAQADILLGPVMAAGPDVPELLKAMEELSPPEGHWADLLSLREEPLWRAEIGTTAWLRAEVLGRLGAVFGRAGKEADAREALAAAAGAGGEAGNPWAFVSPGPLECAVVSNQDATSTIGMEGAITAALGALEGTAAPRPACAVMDAASRQGRLGAELMARLSSTATAWTATGATAGERWTTLMHLARAAASQRDAGVAEAVLNAITVAPEALDEPGAALQVALAAAAAWPAGSQGIERFADVALQLAWRAKPAACAEIEVVMATLSACLPIGQAWRLALARTVASLGAGGRHA